MSLTVALGQVGFGLGGALAGPFYADLGYASNTVIGAVSDAADRSTAFAVSAGIATIALASCKRILGDVAPATSVREIGPRSRR